MPKSSKSGKAFTAFVILFSAVLLSSKDLPLAALIASVIFLSVLSTQERTLPIGLLFAGFYYYLFVFRYLVLLSLHEPSQLGRAVIPIAALKSMLILISQASAVFLCTIIILKPKGNLDSERGLLITWLDSNDSAIFTRILYILTFSGFTIMLISSGGIGSLANALFYHQKMSETQNAIWQIGLTLWSLFSIPALTMDLLKSLNPNNRGRRFFARIRIFLLVIILVTIFGGRLSILIASVITVSIASYIGWPLRKSWAILAVLFVFIFLIIGSVRTGSSTNFSNPEQVLKSATYPVLDAATLVSSNPSDISNQLASRDRYMAYLKSLVPRFLWPNKPLLTDFTLDSQIANTFGWESQRGVTGWPSGFVAEPYLIASSPGVFLYVIVLAVILTLIQKIRTIGRAAKLRGVGFVLNFSLIYTFIAIVKDGDTFSSIQSGVRIFIWLYIVLQISRLLQLDSNKKRHKNA